MTSDLVTSIRSQAACPICLGRSEDYDMGWSWNVKAAGNIMDCDDCLRLVLERMAVHASQEKRQS